MNLVALALHVQHGPIDGHDWQLHVQKMQIDVDDGCYVDAFRRNDFVLKLE
ncbi:hypothetical protein D3C75_1368520 [compost metagenome]